MIRLLFTVMILLAPALTRAQDVPMAVNLAGVNDWSTQQPFIDVMKTARGWIGHKPGQWGGVRFSELRERGLIDENGWPTSIPGDLASIGTLILTDLPEGAEIYAGRYVLRFDGEGIVEVAGAARNVRYGEGRVAFDFTPGGMVLIKIQRTDPRGTGDYVRNISVVRQEHEDAWRRGEIFNPLWLERMQGFEALRFVNWMQTSDSRHSDWAERPLTSDFSYAWRGVPVEVMVRLANRLDAAPWFNMPHLSDDAYSRNFARLVLEKLDEDAKVYVEFSNEVWNWQFDQADWAEARALERWGKEHRWVQYYAMRASQVAKLWSDVFADHRDRLVNVIATQTGWIGLEEMILEAPLWVAENPGANAPPYSYFDAYAVTGYFGSVLGTSERVDLVRGWIRDSRLQAERAARAQGLSGAAFEDFVERHRFDAATRWAVEELADGAITGDPKGTLDDLLNRMLPHHADIARAHGLDLVMYEGGSHVVGRGPRVHDDTLTAFFTHLNYTPEMALLYERLINGWSQLGGGLFMLYMDVYAPKKWGSWGHLRHLGDDNPRWDVIERFK
ncbi:hypothetical protein [Roseovarius salis]|uniref:hypothetical protein n=1 Tax=Roseovarius salis TaxID=3376063 RepID=UPI0037C7FA25